MTFYPTSLLFAKHLARSIRDEEASITAPANQNTGRYEPVASAIIPEKKKKERIASVNVDLWNFQFVYGFLCLSYRDLRTEITVTKSRTTFINPLRPNNDLSQTSHCNFKGLSVREVMRIENMITQVKFY